MIPNLAGSVSIELRELAQQSIQAVWPLWLLCTGGSVPGLTAGGARALPQRLHRDILESFRQLAV
jgi:hypothetical protein